MPIRKIGKIGVSNQVARKRIAEIAEEKGIDRCELCGSAFGIAPAHRHPRSWYKGDAELLSDFRQWIALCAMCHEILDNRSKTSKEESEMTFVRLRGE